MCESTFRIDPFSFHYCSYVQEVPYITYTFKFFFRKLSPAAIFNSSLSFQLVAVKKYTGVIAFACVCVYWVFKLYRKT